METKRNAHFRGSGGQKVVNLLIRLDGASEVLCAADLGLDKVITMDGGGDSSGGHSGGHELQEGHLNARMSDAMAFT
jgi:hypothetical protein